MSTKLDLYIIAFKMYDLQILFIALLEIQLLTGDGQSVQVGLLDWPAQRNMLLASSRE